MADKPHIVLITADELRKDALSCYGNRAISTKNIDALAQSGTRFDKAYTLSPWCLPSRCALTTGLFPQNNGAYSNFRNVRLSSELPNLYSTHHDAGYRVAHVGKCHYAPVPYSETRADTTLPYDEFRDYYISLGIDDLYLQDDKQVSVWFCDDYSQDLDDAGYLEAYRQAVWDKSNQKVFQFPGPAELHPDSWVGRSTTRYLEEYDGQEPLFMWVSFSGPHYPFDPPREYMERVDMASDSGRVTSPDEFQHTNRIHYDTYHGNPGGGIDGRGSAPNGATKNFTDEYWNRLRKSYFANVAQIDDYVGEIIQAIKQQLGENVLIIFTADHGEMLGNHDLWGKNNCAYEDVWNVPLIAKFPNEILPPISNDKVMLTDILATCLHYSSSESVVTDGVPLPERIANGGMDYVITQGEGFMAISDGVYKLTHLRQGEREFTELIDLETDPHEFTNLAGDSRYSAKQSELQQAMIDTLMSNVLR